MDEFEFLLEAERVSAERFVRFKLSSKADADDVLQEVFLTAYRKFPQLKNRGSFRAWVISIAMNKCNDYFRKKAAQNELPIDALTEQALSDSRHVVSVVSVVRETLRLLGDKDKQILLPLLLERAASGGNCKAAEYPSRDGKKQTAYGKAELQKQVSVSHRHIERRTMHEKAA